MMMIVSMINLSLMFYFFSFTINNMGIMRSFGFPEIPSNFVSFLIFLKLYESIGWVTSIL